APGRERPAPLRPAVRPQTPEGTSSGRGRRRADDASLCSDGPPLAQPFGRAPYVVNTTEVLLFRRGGKIFAGNRAEPVVPGGRRRTRPLSRGAQTSCAPFPSCGPPRQMALVLPCPKALFQRALWRVDLEWSAGRDRRIIRGLRSPRS